MHHSLQGPTKCLVSAAACKDMKSVTQLHALMLVTGILSAQHSTDQLIASYARVGRIAFARQVFEESPHRAVSTWNAMIVAYSRLASTPQVLLLYKRMILQPSPTPTPDSSTFTLTLKACATLSHFHTGQQVWSMAIRLGYKDDVFVASAALSLYAKCGHMDRALTLFDQMPNRDIVSWTIIVTGYAQSGRPLEAIHMYRLMQREGVVGDGVLMLPLIHSCSHLPHPKLALSVHAYIIRHRLPMDVMLETSLVDMYAKNRQLKLASLVFHNMSHPNLVSWSSLISGFAQNGFAGDALHLFVDMQNHGYKPDLVSLVSALVACAHVGFLKLGKSIHAYIVRRLLVDHIAATALVDMYSKCGSLSSALALFDGIDLRDLISWNAIIASCGVHGYGREALSLFLQMMKTGLRPDHTTFASLLSACSHSGLVEQGLHWFDVMREEFNIHPTEKHYACVVDLLARAGQVDKAHGMIESMAVEPGPTVWVAFLAGCLNSRKLDLGLKVARTVLELRPDDPGIYTLVSNIFAAASKWNEVAIVRKAMKNIGMKKAAGHSIVEVNGRLNTFLMEDKSHPQHDKIIAMLERLDQDIRDTGHEESEGEDS